MSKESNTFSLTPAAALLLVVFALLAIGTVMVYSSSAIYAEKNWGTPYFFFQKHLLRLVLGTIFLGIAVKIPYQKWQSFVPLLLLVSVVMMLLTLIPGIGKEVGNAKRWISFFGFIFQPAEFLKFTLVLWAASFIARKREWIGEFSKTTMPLLLLLGFFFFLLLLQPDFGTAVLISITLMLMLFAAGAKFFHVFGSLSVMAVVGAFLIASKDYRMRRITAFLDPWADPLDSGFQLIQSFLAFGSGGIFGRGLGDGVQKRLFLPEAHTDFILSVLAEETGLIGVVVVLALVLLFLWQGMRLALQCKDEFGRNLAFGLTLLIVMQSFLNFGVVVGLLPTKGIPFPFISYGGSALLMNLIMVGVLVNIAIHSKSHHS